MEAFAREIGVMRHRALLAKMSEAFKHLGFSKKGPGVWRWSKDRLSFAGFLAYPRPQRGSKRIEFRLVTMGGFAELHETCWPSHLKWRPFGLGAEFAQFEHNMLDPKGNGFVAKVWTLWPSTDIEQFWPELHARIVEESFPAIEIMTNRDELLTALESSISGGPIYIRAKEYRLSQEIIRRLKGENAYS